MRKYFADLLRKLANKISPPTTNAGGGPGEEGT